LFVGGDCDWSFARIIAAVVTTTSIILSSNKARKEINGDILVPANPGPPGKRPLYQRENESKNGNKSMGRYKYPTQDR